MKDIQSQKDKRGLAISEVGVSSLKIPIFFGHGACKQLVIATLSMGVELPPDLRGTHMSRFLQLAQQLKNKELDEKLLVKILHNIKTKLGSRQSKIGIDFIYFLSKKAPVSKLPSVMGYSCQIESKTDEAGKVFYYFQVKVPVATLCPCSKEISRYGAHNQRAEVMLRVKTQVYIDLVELIKVIEARSSSELYSLLKRPDEKYVTEKMYENPMFVEDVAREVGLWAKNDKRIQDYIVKCLSFESIHNHNAYAIIIREK